MSVKGFSVNGVVEKYDYNELDNKPDGMMTAEFKLALETLLNHVAYVDADGQEYLDALHTAMYPPANLISISAVYTQSSPVYTTDSLDSLRSDLVVTAHYANSTSEIVTSYVLSGTLTVGVSVITVSYGGKTTTFSVTVTELSYVSNGLIHRWDAIENTENGHNSSATTWDDIVGSSDLVMNDPSYASWSDNALVLSGNVNQYLDCIGGQLGLAENTVEVVISPPEQASAAVVVNFGVNNNVQRSACLFSDSTFNMNGNSSKSYPVGVTSFADFHYMAAAYTANSAAGTFYANGSAATEGSATHSLSSQRYDRLRVGATNSSSAAYPYAGKIHAIRIYNRLLTAEEIANNYAVDVARFSLGE